jgi:hypothetical protein
MTGTSYCAEEVTEEKFLGKIISAEFGLHKDYPFYGLTLEFKCTCGNVGCDCTVNISKECRWEGFERQEAIAKNAEFVSKILKDAKCNYVSELKDKPVEVTVEGNTFKSFRILTEVL